MAIDLLNDNSSSEVNGIILTKTGAQYEQLPEVQNELIYFRDGRLLLAEDASTETVHYWRSLIRILDLTHANYKTEKVKSDVIRQFYLDDAIAQNKKDSSETQQDIARIFVQAVAQNTSDVHIIYGDELNPRIEFRINGDLFLYGNYTESVIQSYATTIYQTMCDISGATYNPKEGQDARISDKRFIPESIQGIRVGTIPTSHGSAMTCRLLYKETVNGTSRLELGFTKQQNKDLSFICADGNGLVIIGGPTNSGKSTTLKQELNALYVSSNGTRRIITIEDPPEYPIVGALQSPVPSADSEDERTKMFHGSIRASLRNDPDIIMVGEIRDHPSAELTFNAAITGHQVFTTLHVNNAFQIPDRLINIGIREDLVFDPDLVKGLCCQRLVKVLCPYCKFHLTEKHLHWFNELQLETIANLDWLTNKIYLRNPVGCDFCKSRGTISRTLVTEVVRTDRKLLNLLRDRNVIEALIYWRSKGGIRMVEHALLKIYEGSLDPFETAQIVGKLYGFE